MVTPSFSNPEDEMASNPIAASASVGMEQGEEAAANREEVPELHKDS